MKHIHGDASPCHKPLGARYSFKIKVRPLISYRYLQFQKDKSNPLIEGISCSSCLHIFTLHENYTKYENLGLSLQRNFKICHFLKKLYDNITKIFTLTDIKLRSIPI